MAKHLPFRLILASGSLGRRELLQQAGYNFEVMPSRVAEPTGQGVTDPRRFVHEVAWLKAAAVAPQVAEGVVLAADSVAWAANQIIGKPDDEADARRILRLLGAAPHQLWTGVVLWRRPDDLQLCWQEATEVAFQQLSDAELDAYLATRLWQGCSGAYALQGENDPFVRVVRGSPSNVVGLPMESLERGLGLMASRHHGS